MSIEERKARLVSIILSSEGDELISLLEEDVAEYNSRKQVYITDRLSPEELEESKSLAADENPDNYITYDEFKAEMESWRSR